MNLDTLFDFSDDNEAFMVSLGALAALIALKVIFSLVKSMRRPAKIEADGRSA